VAEPPHHRKGDQGYLWRRARRDSTDTPSNGVTLGAGLVDFEQVLPLLARAGKKEDIIFSMEVDTDDRYEDECTHDSYAYLEDWLVRSGHTEHLKS